MKLRVPYFYKEFECLADRCNDSCCVGWEIDIDPDTYEYYASLEGEFGERLQKNIRTGRETSFILKNGRCPFLNKENLCAICTELGEESLCEICTEYPRFTIEYGDVTEKCLGISCEEAGRLIFGREAKITFEETVLPVVYPDDEENKELIPVLEQARDHAIAIMQDRTHTVPERIDLLVQFAEDVQSGIDHREVASKEQKPQSPMEEFLAFKQRMKQFDELEVLDEEWKDTKRKIKEQLIQAGPKKYHEVVHEFMEFYKDRDYEYEHLMVYFIFRYGMKSVFDRDFLGKIRFGVLSFFMIRDMDVERFLANGKQFSLEDRIDIARIYSKEVEHSEENLEKLS